MKIGGYLKTSLIEWPEKISSVIFTAGCNFRCPFCHNADLVADSKRGWTLIPEKEILTDLKKRKEWNEAVIVTGGEPTIQKDLPVFLKKIKKLGYLIMLHTNGTNPKMIKSLIKAKLIDRISMDIKGDFENYEKYTNVPSKEGRQDTMYNIQKSLKLIIKSGMEFELRTTVVPGLHDQENLLLLANQLKEILNTKYLILNAKWYLQQFGPLNTFNKEYIKIKPFSKEEMVDIKSCLEEIIPQTYLRGV